jgi:hypothetical protein
MKQAILVCLLLLVSVLCDVNPTCSHKHVDVTFLVDGSSSIPTPDFNQVIKPFLKQFVDHLNWDSVKQPSRISLIQFSNADKTRLVLPMAGDKIMVERAVENMQKIGGSRTDTKGGLELALDQFNSAVELDHKRVLVILTDGHDAQSEEAVKIANQLKEQNVQIITVGIGKAVNVKFLDSIASEPVPKNSFHIRLLPVLRIMLDPLLDRVCATPSIHEIKQEIKQVVTEVADISAKVLDIDALERKLELMEAQKVQRKYFAKNGASVVDLETLNKKIALLEQNLKKHAKIDGAKVLSKVLGSCADCTGQPISFVCTASGKKFANKCYAECKGQTVVDCPTRPLCICPEVTKSENLCGATGHKYASECQAKCRGDTIVQCVKCTSKQRKKNGK